MVTSWHSIQLISAMNLAILTMAKGMLRHIQQLLRGNVGISAGSAPKLHLCIALLE